MLRLCEVCKDPVTRVVVSGRHDQTATKYFCYIHAIEAGVLDVPLPLLEPVAFETGYSVNAIIFALESLTRAGCIAEAEAADQGAWRLSSAKTALELCVALSQAAVERFQQQAGLALNHWKITRGKDLGAILSALVRCGALAVTTEVDMKPLEELSTMDGPLIVAA
jgi:uncharacterized repeat protein (TIGR04138 family)